MGGRVERNFMFDYGVSIANANEGQPAYSGILQGRARSKAELL